MWSFGDKDESICLIPRQLHVANQLKGRSKKASGWISFIDSYLTLSLDILIKEDGTLKSYECKGEV